VAALAGYDTTAFDGHSPSSGASPVGPSFTGGQRTSRLAPQGAGGPARLQSMSLAAVAGVL
jgi:hypothetical protein